MTDRDDYNILYDDRLGLKDYWNFIALLWRIPAAVIGSVIMYALIKLEGDDHV